MKRAFVNANVMDIYNRRFLPGCTVMTEDGVITAVGDCDTAGAEIVDLSGKYLTPGLFNCHVHATMSPVADVSKLPESEFNSTLTALESCAEYIKTGVTFIRDTGAKNGVMIQLKRAVESGRVKMAPDMLVSDKAICMTGGTGWNFIGYQVDGPDEARKAARIMIRNGAETIKLMSTGGVCTHATQPMSSQLTIEEMRAAVEEAHKAGLKTCCHAESVEGTQNAVLAGVDCIEHGYVMDDETVKMMAERGVWLCGTTSCLSTIMKGKDDGLPEDFYEKAAAIEQLNFESFIRAYKAGVKCALGSDAGTPFCPHSDTAAELIVEVDRCGLDPWDAWTIGTVNSAELCEVSDKLGSVTVGKKAHFAVFDADPVADIHVSHDCVMTVKNGEILWEK